MDNNYEIIDFDENEYSGNAKISGNKGARVDKKNISFLRRFGMFAKKMFKKNPERLVEDAEKALEKNKSYDYINTAYLDALEVVDKDTNLDSSKKDDLYSRLSVVAAENGVNHFVDKANENVYTIGMKDIEEIERCISALKMSPNISDEDFKEKIYSVYVILSAKIEYITDEKELKSLIDLFNNTIDLNEIETSSLWYKQLCGEDWNQIVSLKEKIADNKKDNLEYYEEADELLKLYDKYGIFPKERVDLAAYTNNYYLDEENEQELDEIQPRISSSDDEQFEEDDNASFVSEDENDEYEVENEGNEENDLEETKLEPVTVSEDSKEMESTVSELEKMMSSFNTLLDKGDFFGNNGTLQNKGNEILAEMKKFESLLQQKKDVLQDLEKSLESLVSKAEEGNSIEQEKEELLHKIESLLNDGMINEDMANTYKEKIVNIKVKGEVFDHNSALTKLNYLEGKQIEDPIEYSKECDEFLATISKLKLNDAVHAMVYKYIEGKVVELKNKALEMQVEEKNEETVESENNNSTNLTAEKNEKTKLEDIIDLSAREISKLMNKKKDLEDQLDELLYKGSTSLVITDLKQQIKKLNNEIEFYKNKIEPIKEKIYQKNSEFIGKTQKQIKAIAKYNSDKIREEESAEAYEGEKKYLEELLKRMLNGEDIDKEYEETKQLLQEAKDSLSKEQYDSLNAYVKLIGESKNKFLDFRTKQKESEVRQGAYNHEMQRWNTLLEKLNNDESIREKDDFLHEYGEACTIFENNKQHYTKNQLIVLEEIKNKVQNMIWQVKDEGKTR